MKNIKELKYTDLKKSFNIDNLNFETTKDVEPLNSMIGQKRAIDAIKSSMQIEQKGFNLYMSGSIGIGKTAYALSIVNNLSKNKKVPHDYCYIYNFEDPNSPIAVELEAGQGAEFKEDMNRFVTSLLKRLAKDLSGDIYEKEKKTIVDRYSRAKEEIMNAFDKKTFEQGFKVRKTPDGIYFSPVHNGVILNEKDFNVLDEKTKKYFEEKSPEIQEQTMKVLKELDDLDKQAEKVISQWQENLVTFATTQCMSELKLKYKNNLKIQNFLYSIQSDIVTNKDKFKQYEDSKTNSQMPNSPQAMQAMMMANAMKTAPKPWDNYRVNVLVDNDRLYHAPVVVCKNPNYFDLFGKLEFETGPQGVKTSYQMLKPGLIHKANGGYLIINVKDLLNSAPTWEAFKRVLKTGELSIDSSRDIAQPVTVVSLKPEPIKIDIQVILIGSEIHYQQLCTMDVEFKKLFKMKADFDDIVDRNKENVQKLIEYIAYVCKSNNLLCIDKSGIKELIEHSSRVAENKDKLSAIKNDLSDIIIEANYIAKNSKKKIISSSEIKKALDTKVYRYSKFEDYMAEMISKNDIIISTDDEKVGQINGLTVTTAGECSFGRPVRITANTFIGKSGVVNIEREVALSGSSHSKGVYILSAYIGEKYAQDVPLSLTASICFEQLYNGVDGDSASSTELYAILSSLSGVPIKQNLAVTGSVNQKGEIQPIGGVNDKIEGFYKVCKQKGLNTDNGVLIPVQNVKNLNLNDEVIEAVKTGTFHIYPISTIDEGIELLTGRNSGEMLDDGTYEKDSINYLVQQKLNKYAKNAIKFNM